MEASNVESIVFGILETVSRCGFQVRGDSDLRNDLDLDSLGTLLILNELEDAFRISLREEDFHQVASAGDIVEILRKAYLGVPAE
ncbi:MAG: acyl carrier protein [Fibrobacteria bacterium]|nr:acyl carrier protein [Fibrobacteria bacterium]